MEREHLGSRLGFILLSAGCAIGVGNVWKFPWMVGQFGGGAFVLVYLICLLVMGIPIMTAEFALGRAAQKSPVRLYQALAPEDTKWHIHGYLAMIGNYVLMMFYTVVCGWLFYYFVNTAKGTFNGLDAKGVGAAFGALLSDPATMVGYMILVTFLGFFVCSFSLKGGLERVTKYLMVALLLIMVVLAGHSFGMAGAAKGLNFYLKPDFAKITPAVIVAAMNQAFFTLSLGIGCMAIFGSYIGKEHALLGEAVNVTILDTFVAIVSGLIIFPACFTYNVAPGAGPALLFVTLPNIFNNMEGGQLFGTFFFLFMCFAAFSTVLAVFENILACCRDLTDWSRKKASVINFFLVTLLSLPCALGFNVWGGFQPFGKGSCVLDLEDFVVSNCLLPIGAILYLVFCTTHRNFGWDKFESEANAGAGMKVPGWMRPVMTYFLPIIIFIIFALGLWEKFK